MKFYAVQFRQEDAFDWVWMYNTSVGAEQGDEKSALMSEIEARELFKDMCMTYPEGEKRLISTTPPPKPIPFEVLDYNKGRRG